MDRPTNDSTNDAMNAPRNDARSAGRSRRVFLVRHGAPRIDPARPADDWPLDPEGIAAVERLRSSGRLPAAARWFSSPEPKAQETARLLTDAPIEVVAGLAEQLRLHEGWIEDLPAVRRRAFERPEESAHRGWEPLAATSRRVEAAARELLAAHPHDDLVIVGDSTTIAVLAGALTNRVPDPELPDALGFPDLLVIEMRRKEPVAPPRFPTVIVLAALLAVVEILGQATSIRLGVVSGVAAVIGALLTIDRRSRRLGLTLVAAAAIAVLVAIMLVVAGAPRTGA